MNSKNISAKARQHIGRVKELDCSVCDAPGPSDAHHIDQGSSNGWHGRRVLWKIKKMGELDALNVTISRLNVYA